MVNKQEETTEQPTKTPGELAREKWNKQKECQRRYAELSQIHYEAKDLATAAEKKATDAKQKAAKANEEATKADDEFLDALLKAEATERELHGKSWG